MQTQFALVIDTLVIRQMRVWKNLHVFHPITLLKAAKAKRLATHHLTHRVSRAWSARFHFPLVLGKAIPRNVLRTMSWITIPRVEYYAVQTLI